MWAIKCGLLYTGKPNEVLKNVYIVVDGRRIAGISQEKPDCEVVSEAPVATPAFIDPHSHIGMERAGEPSAEGEANEMMKSIITLADALDSIYMDDKSFKESIEHGVLYSCVLPGSGNIIGGKAVVIRNYASNTEDAFIKYAGIKAALGFNPRRQTQYKGDRPYTRMGVVALFRNALINARKQMKLIEKGKKVPEEIDPETDMLMDVLRGKHVLRVHLHKTDDIMTLLRLRYEFGLKVTIEHACDVNNEETFRKIKDAGIPIVYGPVDAFAYKTELKHESWRNIGKLVKVNPFYGLMTDHPVILQRNLLLQLRFFRRFGLSRSECISIITKNNAEILGLDRELGTIEPGKWASIVLWNGDPFSLESYPIEVYAEGRKVYGGK